MCPANAAPAEATTATPYKMSRPTSGAPNNPTPAGSVNTTRTPSPTGNLMNGLRSHLANDPDKQTLPAGLANLTSRPNLATYPSFPPAPHESRPIEPPPDESGLHVEQADPPPPPGDPKPASTAITFRIPNEQLLAAERYIYFRLRIKDVRLMTPHSYNPNDFMPSLNAAFSMSMGDKIGSEDGLPAQAYNIKWMNPPPWGTPKDGYFLFSIPHMLQSYVASVSEDPAVQFQVDGANNR